MTLQDDYYVLQSSIGITLRESLIIQARTGVFIFIYSTRAKLRACDEEFDWLSSYHSRCFYTNYKPDMTQLESGFLKSTLLIKVCRFSLALRFVLHT